MENFYRQGVDRNGVRHGYLHGSWEESSDFDWEDLCDLARNRCDVLWLSSNAYVCLSLDGSTSQGQMFSLTSQGHMFSLREGHTRHFEVEVIAKEGADILSHCRVVICSVRADEPTHELEQLFQLLNKKPADELSLIPPLAVNRGVFPTSAQTLVCLLGIGCCHKQLRFIRFDFSQQHCQVLASFRGSTSFIGCSFADEGRSIFEAIGNDRGLTGLQLERAVFTATPIRVDVESFCNALRNTTSLRLLKIMEVSLFRSGCLDSIQQNRSLVELAIGPGRITNQGWVDIFGTALKHRTLEKFSFHPGYASGLEDTDSARIAQTQPILEMIRDNEVLYRLEIEPSIEPSNLINQQFFTERIQPYLTANLYRRRFKTLVNESDPGVQRQLFGRTLTHTEVNENPRIMFQLFSCFDGLLSELYRETKTQDEDTALVSNTSSGKKRSWSQLNA